MAGQPSNCPLATSNSVASGVKNGSGASALPLDQAAKTSWAMAMRRSVSPMPRDSSVRLRPPAKPAPASQGGQMDAALAELLSLDGQTALVTGAATGIGEGIAKLLARAGAQW